MASSKQTRSSISYNNPNHNQNDLERMIEEVKHAKQKKHQRSHRHNYYMVSPRRADYQRGNVSSCGADYKTGYDENGGERYHCGADYQRGNVSSCGAAFQTGYDENGGKRYHEVVDITVIMLNKSKAAVKLQASKDWRGDVHGALPDTIEVSKDQKFSHMGLQNGSEGAVIYRGPNSKNDDCAWVLAWSCLCDGTPNKVYMECGPLENYTGRCFEWEDIKTKLNSSSTNIQCSNSDTKTAGSASCKELEHNSNDFAVSATFDVTIK